MEGDSDKENESKVVVSQVHQIQHLRVLSGAELTGSQGDQNPDNTQK